MTPDQIQQFNMLQDVITEFSDNPLEKRSLTISKRCVYNPPINKPLSKGCAIGMYLTVDIAKKLDKKINGGINSILVSPSKKLLPKWLLKMNENFLYSVQALHDTDSNWTEINISNTGKITIENICKKYELPFDNLKFNQL